MTTRRALPSRPETMPGPGHRAGARHDHLWSLPEGLGLHAPIGSLAVEGVTGRVRCHLCGEWFFSLVSHVRVHGYTADSYREAMGLMRTRALVAVGLSASIAARQTRRYRESPGVREFLAPGQALARSGQPARRARNANTAREFRPGRLTARAGQLARWRATEARRWAARLAALGAATLPGYLRTAYAAAASMDQLRQVTGLGREPLRSAMREAGITPRPAERDTLVGKRSRAVTAGRAAADMVGASDLGQRLGQRRSEGCTLQRPGTAVGHSGAGVQWRLDPACLP